MASCTSMECCLYIHGTLSMRELADACGSTTSAEPKPFIPVGEMTQFGFTPLVKKIGGEAMKTLDGGTSCVFTRFDGLTVAMKIRCGSNSNLALALFGEVGTQSTAKVTDELIDGAMVAYGAYVPFEFVGAKNVVITSPSGAVEGIDYKVTPAGLEIKSKLLEGKDLMVNYEYDNQSRVEVGVKGSQEREFLFNGKDQNGNAIVIRLYRVSIAAEGQIDWLGDNFLEFQVSGTALPDDNRPATAFAPGLPVSQFGFIQRTIA